MAGPFTGDSRNPDRGPGIVPAQDFSWQKRGVPLRNRAGRLAVRIAGRQVREGDIGGKWVYADGSVGDMTGMFLWPAQARELPTWREAMPAVRVSDEGASGDSEAPGGFPGPAGEVGADSRGPTDFPTQQGAPGDFPTPGPPNGGPIYPGGTPPSSPTSGDALPPEPAESVTETALKPGVRPTAGRARGENPGFAKVEPAVPKAEEKDGKKGERPWPEFPVGYHGLVVSSSDDLEQVEYWHPTDPRLIAVNCEGNTGAGSLVADLTKKNEIDTERMAPLQAALRVVKKPSGDFSLENNKANALALQIGRSKKKDVLALIADGSGALARATARDGGPFDVGAADDKHSLGEDEDGTKINPLHLSARAFYRDDKKHDGPLEFSDVPYPSTLAGSFYVPVFLSFDAGHVYRWPYWAKDKRRDEGMWKWWAPVFLGAIGGDPDDPTRDEDPRGPGSPPGDTNPPPPTTTPGGGGGGDPGSPGGGGGGPPPGGGGGGPTTPGGGSPPGGGGGGPTTPGGGNIIPPGWYPNGPGFDGTEPFPNTPRGGGGGSGAGPGPPGGDTNGGPTTPSGGSGSTSSTQKASGGSSARKAQTAGLMTETGFSELFARPQAIGEGLPDYAHGYVNPKAKSLFDRTAPATLRMVAYAKQAGNEYERTNEPKGSRYHGGTADGGVALMPPETGMLDADEAFAPPGTTTSTSYLTLTPGVRLAFGIPSVESGGAHTAISLEVDETGLVTVRSHDANGVETDVATVQAGIVTLAEGTNLKTGATTGSKIGTAANEKVGFHGATPTAQESGWTAPVGGSGRKQLVVGADTLSETQDTLASLMTWARNKGFHAT